MTGRVRRGAELIAAVLLLGGCVPRKDPLASAAFRALNGRPGCVLVAALPEGRLLLDTAPDWSAQRKYPPGSVFKIASACALAAFPAEGRFCSGRYLDDGRSRFCSLRSGHGWMDIESALAQSCNGYFREAGGRRSAGSIIDAAIALGFVEPDSVPALRAARPSDLAVGDVPALSLPPRRMLEMVARWARERPVAAEPWRVVRSGLRRCVSEGTARSSAFDGLDAAGKTGSGAALDGSGVTHGWFAGFAPAADPRIAVVVFLEKGRGADAARVAGEVMSWCERNGLSS